MTFLPLIVIVELKMEASKIKLWVSFLRKTLVQIAEANKTNTSRLSQLAVIQLLLRKTKSKVIKTSARINAISVIRKVTISIST